MPGTTIYPGANTTAQWFASAYPGVIMSVTDILVLHTTETGDWPGYSGGASAPTMTIKVDTVNRKLLVRQHFPLDMSARALVHPSGTPATNTAGVIQIEMIGTCDKATADRYGYFYWPSAPTWVKDQLAALICTLKKSRGIPLKAIGTWLSYPSSYGNTASRMTWSEWGNFSGVCGHQHVPGNDHGDPGNLDIAYIMAKANEIYSGDDMSAADVNAINAHLDSKIDDIAEAVWAKVINRPWDGRPSSVAGLLGSTHYYAVSSGAISTVPDTASTAPGQPTTAKRLADSTDTVEATLAVLADDVKGKASKADVDALSAKLDAVLALLKPPAGA